MAELLTLGLSTETIAARLHISRHTLRDHVKSIFAKLGAKSRSELRALAWDHLGPGSLARTGSDHHSPAWTASLD